VLHEGGDRAEVGNAQRLGADRAAGLEQLADAYAVYWFSWSVYYPDTDLYLSETP